MKKILLALILAALVAPATFAADLLGWGKFPFGISREEVYGIVAPAPVMPMSDGSLFVQSDNGGRDVDLRLYFDFMPAGARIDEFPKGGALTSVTLEWNTPALCDEAIEALLPELKTMYGDYKYQPGVENQTAALVEWTFDNNTSLVATFNTDFMNEGQCIITVEAAMAKPAVVVPKFKL